MNRWQRVWAYILQRLGEPSTWAGIVAVITGLGMNVTPEKAEAIAMIGTTLSGILLMATREGANTATNPTLPAAVKGELPDPKAPIVPPKAEEPPAP